MTDRVVLRIFCSKSKGGHQVGQVIATRDGHLLRYTAARRVSVDGFDGLDREVVLGTGDTTWAWCKSCRMRLALADAQLLQCIGQGVAKTKLIDQQQVRTPMRSWFGVLSRAGRRDL